MNENILPTCRLDSGYPDHQDLIQPCICKGSMKYVHRHCLDTWRKSVGYLPSSRINNNDVQCEICKFEYESENGIRIHRIINKCKVAFEVFIWFILLQALGFGLGVLITNVGKNSAVFTNKINIYIYMWIIGSFIIHFICGIIAICFAVYDLPSDTCFIWFCVGGGDGSEILIFMFMFICIAFVGVFIVLYGVIIQRGIERQNRHHLFRIKDQSIMDIL
jgi:hypothetical protein